MSPDTFSFANLTNLAALETLYEKYTQDPRKVDPSWRLFFEGLELGIASVPLTSERGSTDLRVHELIYAYRTYGHLLAHVNPLESKQNKKVPELELNNFGFTEADLDTNVPSIGFLKEKEVPLRTLVDALQTTYCRTIGIEYMDLGEPKIESWIQKRIEPYFALNLSSEEKIDILHALNKAEIFESFLHTKYVGQKRFSLEGGETMIPMLVGLLEEGAEEGVKEAVLGMAHRGRLNVLANILNKSYTDIFREFEDHYIPNLCEGTGDVKYHKGFRGAYLTKSREEIKVTLSPNPSHLESVDPVLEGEVRALQELRGDRSKRKEVVPILIHGDAAIAGQGVVYETVQLSRLNGYATGGTLHIIINNQIGFTTLPKDTRSTRYCTDIARAFGSPVFHVNAEDPEGCVAVAKLAIALRQTFECDVFIDLLCYRKYGHNEGDEPTFTQPLAYRQIHSKQSVRTLYRTQLIRAGVINETTAAALETEFKEGLQTALESITSVAPTNGEEKPSAKGDLFAKIETSVCVERLQLLARTFCHVQEGFHIHPKIQKLLGERLAMMSSDKASIDWGMGEHLAYATLLTEGVHVRIAGQDVRRGTFSHRHGVWVDQKSAEHYFPLSHLDPKQALFDLFNSPLSEFAALGFEFGYTLFYPNALVIWEAQYGDFVNGGQIIIDQYLSSSEQKWNHTSNLTLFLPHGYEGQGPEHSSARLERFLQLCGEENMQVANVTTPAQLFHLLRRQAKRAVKKPLILFTPKALLRHPQCVSRLHDFTEGTFEELLDDPCPREKTERILFCSGKIFYDLMAERERRNAFHIAILRVEQLYPLNRARVQELLQKYSGFKECIWVQEEHENMGAWEYMRPLLDRELGGKMSTRYVGRGRSAAPAAGSFARHKKQHLQLLQEAFA
ncbi:MAG: 2-oxoglutarate dehydrogenase E1 component [Chlamydiales bacterium]